jgi:uncharacterized protein with beta-barrel porin domain
LEARSTAHFFWAWFDARHDVRSAGLRRAGHRRLKCFCAAYGAKSVTDPRSELGFRADKSYAMQDGVLTLRGGLAWAHDYDTDRSIRATFQTLPGASFVVNGAVQVADTALTTAAAEMRWRNGVSVSGVFEGEFGSNVQSYAGKGVVRYQW